MNCELSFNSTSSTWRALINNILTTVYIIFDIIKPRRPKGEKKIAKLFFSGVAFQTICPVIYVQKMGQNIHFLRQLWTAVTWLRAKRFEFCKSLDTCPGHALAHGNLPNSFQEVSVLHNSSIGSSSRSDMK